MVLQVQQTVYINIYTLVKLKNHYQLQVYDATTITVSLGTSDLAHTYIRGGLITNANYGEIVISNAVYNNSTGVCTITTTTNHGLSVSDVIKLSGLVYSTTEGDKILRSWSIYCI